MNQNDNPQGTNRLTASDSAHILTSIAKFAEERAQYQAPNEATSRRLLGVAERLRTQAQEFSGRAGAR